MWSIKELQTSTNHYWGRQGMVWWKRICIHISNQNVNYTSKFLRRVPERPLNLLWRIRRELFPKRSSTKKKNTSNSTLPRICHCPPPHWQWCHQCGAEEGYYGWDSPSHRGKAFEWVSARGWPGSATKRKSKQKPRPSTLASSTAAAAASVEKCLYHNGRASTNTPIMYCICNTARLIHIHSLYFL